MDADDIRGQFSDHWEADLMGHSGRIEDASQEVEFALFDVARLRENFRLALAWPMLQYESTTWSSRKQKIDYLLSCRNEGVMMKPFRGNLPTDGNVTLRIESRHVA